MYFNSHNRFAEGIYFSLGVTGQKKWQMADKYQQQQSTGALFDLALRERAVTQRRSSLPDTVKKDRKKECFLSAD